MANEKSLIFVIKADVESFNKSLKDAERSFNRSFGNIKKLIDDTARKTAIAGGAIVAAIGLAVSKLSNISEEIEKALPEDVEALKNFGIVIEPSMLEAGRQMADLIRQAKLAVDLFLAKIGEAANIQHFIERMIEITGSVKNFVDKNSDLIRAIRDIGVALIVLTGVLKAFSIGMAIAKSLSGPAGWAQLAVGGVLAVGTASAVDKLFRSSPSTKYEYEGQTFENPTEETEMWLIKMGAKKLVSGGIVTRPTLAMIGEAGPEAVVPLSGGVGSNVTVNLSAGVFMGNELEARQFARMINRHLQAENGRKVYTPNKTEYYSPGKHL